MESHLRKRLIGFALIASLCLVQACKNLGPTGGHRAEFTAGTITSLSPSTIIAGGPPFNLTVFGSILFPDATVLLWNGVQQIPPVIAVHSAGAATQVTYLIDAGLIANPGTISLELIVPTAPPDERPSNTLTLTIAPRTTTACALFGLYNFLFTGFDTRPLGIPQFNKNNGGAIFAGAFGVDTNGNLSGELDWTDYPFRSGGFSPVGGSPIAGTCTNGATPNQGNVTFKFVDNFSNPVTLTFMFLLQQGGSGPTRGRLIKFADMNSTLGTLAGTGVFVATGPDAVLNGDYAFGLVGIDPGDSGSGSQIGVAGRFTCSNGNLSVGVADINDGGVVTANAPVAGAMFPNTPPDLYSRVARDLTIGGQLVHLGIYVNSSGGGFAIGEIPSQTANTRAVAGFISPQTNSGSYTNGSLNAPLVFSTWGAPAPLYTGSSYTASSDTTLGLASGFNSGAGTFNLQFDQVSGGVANLNQSATATYSVASNGRAVVSYSLGGKTLDYVFYLDGSNDGFILGESSNAAEFGFFQPQAPGPFTTATINGTFASATFLPMTPTSPNFATEITLNNGTLSATTPSGALTGAYTVAASGRGTGSVNLPVLGSKNLVLYVISPTGVVVMGSDNTMSDAITFMHF